MDAREMREMKEHVVKLQGEISRLRVYRRIVWMLAAGVSIVVLAFVYYSFSQDEARAGSRRLSEVRSTTDILADRVAALETRSRQLENQLNDLIVMALEERDRVRDVFSHHREVIKSYHSDAFRELESRGALYNFPDIVDQRGQRAIEYFRQQLSPRTPSTFRPGAVKRLPQPTPKPYMRQMR